MGRITKKHLRECTLAFLMPVLCIAAAAAGAEDYAPTRATNPHIAQDRLKTRITYSCVNLPIETVLMNLAEQAKIDIVKSPRVTGNVTVKVTDVPLEEALTNILAAHDYTYIATESMIRVVPVPEVAALREQSVTRIYQVTYADANEVATALSHFVSERGKVALSKGTSHIIVTDTEGKIKAIDKFIERIDLITPQVLVEVRIYDITTNEGFELGTEWTAGRNTPLKTTDTENVDIDTDFPTIRRDRIIESTETTSGNYRDADDGPPEGSSFTVESTETESTEIPLGTFFDTETERYTERRRKPFVGGSFDRIEGGTLSFSLLNDAVDLEFVLQVLHQQIEAKLLANPRVLVLDNETANFEIIREFPYTELSLTGRDPITWTRFKEVGINLKVTPHITKDGMLRLHIMPEFGIVVAQNAEGVPTTDIRRADTIAMIRDGQTIAIGGLRQRQTTKDIAKVPLLGDLPLLGGLFKSETESVKVNELVVFITTRIITEPVLSAVERKQLSQTEFESPVTSGLRLEREIPPADRVDHEDIQQALDELLRGLAAPER
ncbi:MAG: secretin N-terminal domain-containing protein [Planctomycetota bacterium]